MTQSGPTFTIGDAARALDVNISTVRENERLANIPKARRSAGDQRIYSLYELIQLQLIMRQHIDTTVLASLLYDKGYTNVKQVDRMLNKAINQIKQNQDR